MKLTVGLQIRQRRYASARIALMSQIRVLDIAVMTHRVTKVVPHVLIDRFNHDKPIDRVAGRHHNKANEPTTLTVRQTAIVSVTPSPSAYSGPTTHIVSPNQSGQGRDQENVLMYNASTLSLAHCVLRRNFKDDLIDGSLSKQLTRTSRYNPLQP